MVRTESTIAVLHTANFFGDALRARGIAVVCTVGMASLLGACGGGGSSDKQSAPPNQAPVSQSFSATTQEDTPLAGTLRASDPENNTLTYSIVAQPSHGTVALSGGSAAFTYTPTANYFGADQFSFQASDGAAVSGVAVVTLSVASVNDAPVIDSVTGPSSVNARSQVVITVASHDIDSPTTLSIQQTSGTQSAAATVAGNTITITAPNSQSTEQLTYRIAVRDDQGATATRDYAVTVSPISPSGNLHTLRGSPTAPGLHLVVTGDGYTQDQQAALLADASAVVATVIDTADIRPYSVAWNVHLLNAVSVESGVDIPSEGVVRNTIFDGTLECQTGVARLLCVNVAKVTAAVIAELPAYTLILVVSNTDRYGGSGGPIAVASRHPASALVALHESGHTFARLADEYVDAVLDTGPIPNFQETFYPNATAVTDLSLVKWRRWFTNPTAVPHNPGEAGVGLFEGAIYRAHGYYRPTDNSYMRSLSENMGPVNAEAWVLSVYQRLGAPATALPQATTVSGPAGMPLDFSVATRFPTTLQKIQWFENGVEVPTAANKATYQCCTVLSGAATLTVKVSEASGLVRAPIPNAAYFEKTWQIQFN